MPWSNQGGGPWGSGGGSGGGGGGGRGPWGQGPQQSGGGSNPPDLEELLRRSQDKLKKSAPGRQSRRAGRLILVAVIAFCGSLPGIFRVQPDELGVVMRFGKYVRDAKPGAQLSPAISDRKRADAEGHARQSHRHRHAHGRRPAARQHGARRAGREPHAHRRREHRRRGLHGALDGQAQRRRRLSVQHPDGRRHGEGGGRKRDARSGRPHGQRKDHDRRAPKHRDRRARADAEDFGQLPAPASR